MLHSRLPAAPAVANSRSVCRPAAAHTSHPPAVPSAGSSLGTDADGAAAAMEELLGRGTPLLPASDVLGPAVSASLARAHHTEQRLQQERQRREAAEAAAVQLRKQLDEVATQLFSFRSGWQQCQQQPSDASASTSHGSNCATLGPDLPAMLRAVLAQSGAALAAQQQRAEKAVAAAAAATAAAGAAAADAACVARMVAGALARAAADEDLATAWRAEKALLERRLERAARMGQAVLKHRSEQSAGGRRCSAGERGRECGPASSWR